MATVVFDTKGENCASYGYLPTRHCARALLRSKDLSSRSGNVGHKATTPREVGATYLFRAFCHACTS